MGNTETVSGGDVTTSPMEKQGFRAGYNGSTTLSEGGAVGLGERSISPVNNWRNYGVSAELGGGQTEPMKDDECYKGTGDETKEEKKCLEDAYVIAKVKFFARSSYAVMAYVHYMIRESKRLYLAVHGWENTMPAYGAAPDNVAASSPHDFHNMFYRPVRTAIGVQSARDYKPIATLTNRSASARRKQAKNETVAAKFLNAPAPGTPPPPPGAPAGAPVTEAMAMMGVEAPTDHMAAQGAPPDMGMSEFFDRHYKDELTHQAQLFINGYLATSDYRDVNDEFWLAFIITYFCLKWVEVNKNTLDIECPFQDPQNAFYDPSMLDSYGTGGRYAGVNNYHSYEEVLMNYPDITRDDLDKLGTGGAGGMGWQMFDQWPIWQYLSGTKVVLVTKVRWIETLRFGDEKGKGATMQEVYEAHIIGGTLVGCYGPLEWQDRDVDNPAKAYLGVFVLRPDHNIDAFAPTPAIRLAPLQMRYNDLKNRIYNSISTMLGTITAINMAAMGGRSVEQVTNELLDIQLLFYNSTTSSADGIGAGFKASDILSSVTIGLPELSQLQAEALELEKEIDNILPRLGDIGQYATAGAAQVNTQAAQDVTAYANLMFHRQTERVMSHITNLMAITVPEQLKRARKRKDKEQEEALLTLYGSGIEEKEGQPFIGTQRAAVRIKLGPSATAKQQMIAGIILTPDPTSTLTQLDRLELARDIEEDMDEGFYVARERMEKNQKAKDAQQMQAQQMQEAAETKRVDMQLQSAGQIQGQKDEGKMLLNQQDQTLKGVNSKEAIIANNAMKRPDSPTTP